jgi:hypothetical protein
VGNQASVQAWPIPDRHVYSPAMFRGGIAHRLRENLLLKKTIVRIKNAGNARL